MTHPTLYQKAARHLLIGLESLDFAVTILKMVSSALYQQLTMKFSGAPLPSTQGLILPKQPTAKANLAHCEIDSFGILCDPQAKRIYGQKFQTQIQAGIPYTRASLTAFLYTNKKKEAYTLHFSPLFSPQGLLETWSKDAQHQLINSLTQIDNHRNWLSILHTSATSSQFDIDILRQDSQYDFFARVRRYDNTARSQKSSLLCVWLKPSNGWVCLLDGCGFFPLPLTRKLHDDMTNYLSFINKQETCLQSFLNDCWNAYDMDTDGNREVTDLDYLLLRAKKLQQLTPDVFASQELACYRAYEDKAVALINALHQDPSITKGFISNHQRWLQQSHEQLQVQWANLQPLLSKIEASIEEHRSKQMHIVPCIGTNQSVSINSL